MKQFERHAVISMATSFRAAADYLDGHPLKIIAIRYGIPTSRHVERIVRRFGFPKRSTKFGAVKAQQRVRRAIVTRARMAADARAAVQ